MLPGRLRADQSRIAAAHTTTLTFTVIAASAKPHWMSVNFTRLGPLGQRHKFQIRQVVIGRILRLFSSRKVYLRQDFLQPEAHWVAALCEVDPMSRTIFSSLSCAG
jgi:hypothetical protein